MSGLTRAVHRQTGLTAYIQKLVNQRADRGGRSTGLCVAQFDKFSHRHSHGWHLYPRRAFRVIHRRS